MVEFLTKSIIKIYLMGDCAVLEITNQDVLSKDLESDPFLNSTFERFTCKLYYRFGSFLTGIITSRHHLSERNVMGTKIRDK